MYFHNSVFLGVQGSTGQGKGLKKKKKFDLKKLNWAGQNFNQFIYFMSRSIFKYIFKAWKHIIFCNESRLFLVWRFWFISFASLRKNCLPIPLCFRPSRQWLFDTLLYNCSWICINTYSYWLFVLWSELRWMKIVYEFSLYIKRPTFLYGTFWRCVITMAFPKLPNS